MIGFFALIGTENNEKERYVVDTGKAFEEFADMVYRLAFLRTNNKSEAEDILSEVFLKLVKNSGKIISSEHLKAWLIRVTVNSTYTLLSSPYRKRRAELFANTEEPVEEKEEVLPLVLTLPKKHKTVIYMHYFEGYSVEEISNILLIPKGTVKSRLSRGRDALKTMLEVR